MFAYFSVESGWIAFCKSLHNNILKLCSLTWASWPEVVFVWIYGKFKIYSFRVWCKSPLVKNCWLASVYCGWRGHWITGLLSSIQGTRWSLLANFHKHLKTALERIKRVTAKYAERQRYLCGSRNNKRQRLINLLLVTLFGLTIVTISFAHLVQNPALNPTRQIYVLLIATETHHELNSINRSANIILAWFIMKRSLVFVCNPSGPKNDLSCSCL